MEVVSQRMQPAFVTGNISGCVYSTRTLASASASHDCDFFIAHVIGINLLVALVCWALFSLNWLSFALLLLHCVLQCYWGLGVGW